VSALQLEGDEEEKLELAAVLARAGIITLRPPRAAQP